MLPDEPEGAFRALYDTAPCGLVTTLANGTIRQVNETFCVWFGFTADELIAKVRLQDLLTMGCRIFHQTHWLPLLQLQGSVAEVQLDFLHRDGRSVPALVNARLRAQSDGVFHDVAIIIATDRRKYERELLIARRSAEELLETVRKAEDAVRIAEARLRLAIEAAQLVVWDVDLATGRARYEAGVQRLLGLPPEAEVTEGDYNQSIHPADREEERQAAAAALADHGGNHYFAEYRLLGYDGCERTVSSRGRAFLDASGHAERFSGVLQDITDRRRAEQMLRNTERESRERAVLAEQLIGIVSHDLRTPLQAVSLGATILGSSSLSPVQARTVNRISSAATRAGRLILDLLDFTQARLGGGLHVNPVQVKLHEVVAEVVDELKMAWPGRMIEHRRQGESIGFADPARIAQLVTNLGNNAIAYGQPSAPILITSTATTDELVVEVHNEGIPIPPDLLPQIFAPLKRGENHVNLGSSSVGLGLYIVRQIATAHRGHVVVTSTAETGTTFTVRLPPQQNSSRA
jgi:sigma-B regulation protein RsbU (phosphoserine phosphatase)